jgi:hypothetical protein
MVGSDAMEVGPGGVNGLDTTTATIDMDTRVRRLCAAVLFCAHADRHLGLDDEEVNYRNAVTRAVINLRRTLRGGANRVA